MSRTGWPVTQSPAAHIRHQHLPKPVLIAIFGIFQTCGQVFHGQVRLHLQPARLLGSRRMSVPMTAVIDEPECARQAAMRIISRMRNHFDAL